MMRSRSIPSRRRVWIGLLIAVTASGRIGAQESAPTLPASQPVLGDLAPAYVDGSFGFSVRPPAHCSLFREKQTFDADVEIARFVNTDPNVRWSFTVRLSTTTQRLDPQAIIEGITARLTPNYLNFTMIRGEPATMAGRPGVRYAATFDTDQKTWLRQQAVIPVRAPSEWVGADSKPAEEYFTLLFITPLEHQAAAERLFDRIVSSFEILRDDHTRERISEALKRGETLLLKVSEGTASITSRLFEDTYYRCIVNGRDIGYVRVSERAATIDKRDGVQVREWGWLFDPSGSITHLQHDMFLAGDLSFERWDKRLYIISPPGKEGAARTLAIDLENAARADRQLLVGYMPQPNSTESKERAIEVERTYASAAWNVLFPRVVNLTRPELYAFSSYKSERRGMVLRTLEVLASSDVVIDGRRVSAVKIEDSEGLIPPKSTIYVGQDGKVLRVVADPLEMVATSPEFIERQFGAQVTEAQNLLARLMPRTSSPKPASTPPRQPSPRAPLPTAGDR